MSLQINAGSNNYMIQNAGYSGYGAAGTATTVPAGIGSPSGQSAAVEGMQNDRLMKKIGAVECKTCASRKYVDGSTDAGVSFKTPTHVSAGGSGAAVRSHEQEHVSRGSAKAMREDREIVSQSVQIYSAVCPECGKAYTSGGKTTTVTKSSNDNKDYFMENMRQSMGNHFGKFFDKRI